MTAGVPAAGSPQTEAAWSPFHSEYSAHAFAKLMSARIERPIDVRRTPSRRYEVFFHYATEAERQQVLQRIAAVAAGATGTREDTT